MKRSETISIFSAVRQKFRHLINRKRIGERSPIRLNYKRIYVFPTWWGIMFLMAVLAMLVGSINYALGLGYASTFMLIGVGIGAMWQAFSTLNGVEFTPLLSVPVFAGDMARFSWQAVNPSRRAKFALSAWVVKKYKTTFDIEENNQTLIVLLTKTSRRGKVRSNQVIVESTFPLGMIRAWGYLLANQECIVFPAREMNGPPLPGMEGEWGEKQHGAGEDDFSGFRPYRNSDSLRQVAWKSYARGAPLLIKKFEGGGGREIWLNWQHTPVSLGMEGRLSRLSNWVWSAYEQGLDFGLEIPGQKIPIGNGIQQAHLCLTALAEFGEPMEEKV